MDNLIVKVSFQDDDPKENLWRKCWDHVKTPVEFGNAAKIDHEEYTKATWTSRNTRRDS